tara:strand:+ start:6074 stop:6940 length:867 start_codon:yes stop_codon:yes gene_type:complete
MLKASVIGLGNMGSGIAKNLHNSGFLLGAWNRSPERVKKIKENYSLKIYDDLEDLVVHSKIIITSVSEDRDLNEIINKISPLLSEGSIILDTSTVSTQTAIDVGAHLASYKVSFLDGPVSGGKEGAHNGSLVMMAGGDSEILEKLSPLLRSFCSKIIHIGAIGSGQTTKAVNQIMAAGINQSVTESLALAYAENLDMERVVDAIGSGAAGNWFLNHRGNDMCNGNFEPGFKVSLHRKDLKICQKIAEKHGLPSLLTNMTLNHYDELINQGFGDKDISILFTLKKKLFD